MIHNIRKTRADRKRVSSRKYCILSVLSSLLLSVLIYFHAAFALFNVVLSTVLIVVYIKYIKRENTRNGFVVSFITAMILCNSFSLFMLVLIVISFIMSAFGSIDINELISTL